MTTPPFAALLATARAGRAWIDSVGDAPYRDAQLLPESTLGAQFRHHLDYLEAYIAGLESGRMDYDGRARDRRCEVDRATAASRAARLEERLLRLAQLGRLHVDAPVLVRECCDAEQPSPWLASTVGRETAAVLSHSIHHFAIMAVTARACGIAVDPALALAPATRRYRAEQTAPANP